MARLKPSPIEISGKFDDVVHVDSNRYPRHVRKPVAAGRKKNEPALKQQYTRTKFLNALASEINTIIKANSGSLKPSTFYHELHRRFRMEPLNNRFLLLMQLKGMEINPAYPLSRLGSHSVSVREHQNKILVDLLVKEHPKAGKHKADCYYYEVLLLKWQKTNKPAMYERQLSEWVSMSNDKPWFEFEFACPPGVVHWLLCIRLKMGVREQSIGVLATEGMQLADAGSSNKQDHELLNKRAAQKPQKSNNQAVDEGQGVVRVKAKKMYQ